MLPHSKNEHLFLLLIPVGSDAFENSRSIMESMSHYIDVGFLDGNNLPLEERQFSRHVAVSFLSYEPILTQYE
jgi:hypothetical protein